MTANRARNVLLLCDEVQTGPRGPPACPASMTALSLTA